LHHREITNRVLAQKLWTTEGKTPWNTVNAQLAVDIKDRGSDSIFVREGRGLFALNPNVAQKLPLVERPGSPEKERNSDAGDRMSFTDAAERVLMESSDREPLHYGAITERALERGLIRTEGRTPPATMYSSIFTEMRRRETRGESPRPVRPQN
jgi:hypothetical protein